MDKLENEGRRRQSMLVTLTYLEPFEIGHTRAIPRPTHASVLESRLRQESTSDGPGRASWIEPGTYQGTERSLIFY